MQCSAMSVEKPTVSNIRSLGTCGKQGPVDFPNTKPFGIDKTKRTQNVSFLVVLGFWYLLSVNHRCSIENTKIVICIESLFYVSQTTTLGILISALCTQWSVPVNTTFGFA